MAYFDACAYSGDCPEEDGHECRPCMTRRVAEAEREAIAKDLRAQAPGYGPDVCSVLLAVATRISRGVRG